jgi:hypothetical protein
MNFKIITVVFFIMCNYITFAQTKYEREFRIRKNQFPVAAKEILTEHLKKGAKRLKFYKKNDTSKTTYESKFKKDKLWYSIEFSSKGNLENIEIIIQPLDIPSETRTNITQYLDQNFINHKVKKIKQQYIATEDEEYKEIFRNAFQNLLLPNLNYEIMISSKEHKASLEYEILFNAEGKFKTKRKRLPPNYDRVLY